MVTVARLQAGLMALALAGCLAACGTDGSAAEKSGPSASAPEDGSLQAVVQAMNEANRSVTTVRVDGVAQGTTYVVRVAPDGCRGSWKRSSGPSFDLVVVDDLSYIRADRASMRSSWGRRVGDQIFDEVGARWARSRSTPDFAVACSIHHTLAEFPDGTSFYAGDPVETELDGDPTLTLTYQPVGQSVVHIWVDASAPHRVRKMSLADISMTFSEYGSPVDVSAPPRDQVVDIEHLVGN